MTSLVDREPRRRPWKLPFRPRTILIHVVAWTVGLAWLLPFIGVAVVSVRPLSETALRWWHPSPFRLTLDTFISARHNPDCPRSWSPRPAAALATPDT